MNKSIRISIAICALSTFALTASAHARGEIQPAAVQLNGSANVRPYAYCGRIQSHVNWLPPQVEHELKANCNQK